MPKYKLIKTSKGWGFFIECKINYIFWTSKKWKPVITYLGTEKPFYFESKNRAIKNALTYFERDILINTYFDDIA